MDRVDVKRLKFELKKDSKVTFHQATDTVIWFKKGKDTFAFYDFNEAHKWLLKEQ